MAKRRRERGGGVLFFSAAMAAWMGWLYPGVGITGAPPAAVVSPALFLLAAALAAGALARGGAFGRGRAMDLAARFAPRRTADALASRYRDIRDIRDMDWLTFERLVSAHYRTRGCRKIGDNGPGKDGGVDIRLRCGGRKILVQCKRWKSGKVTAPVVREMYGLMVAEGADEVHVVSSGRFTRDAWAFTRGKPIRLIGGRALLEMIRAAAEEGQGAEEPVSDARGFSKLF